MELLIKREPKYYNIQQCCLNDLCTDLCIGTFSEWTTADPQSLRQTEATLKITTSKDHIPFGKYTETRSRWPSSDAYDIRVWNLVRVRSSVGIRNFIRSRKFARVRNFASVRFFYVYEILCAHPCWLQDDRTNSIDLIYASMFKCTNERTNSWVHSNNQT